MSQSASESYTERLVIHTRPLFDMSDEQLFQFCQLNRDLQIERTADGDLIVSGPDGGRIGLGCTKLTAALGNWAERDGTGEVFGSSTGFILPNHAMRSPDIAWVRNERLDALSEQEWEKFLPLCPDFVLELRSPSDTLRRLQRKMEEYCQNGTQLGWLLDPVTKSVHIYRPDAAPEILENPATVSGEPLLRGFVLDLQKIWAAMERKKR
jgi:Uma2 family endonuclease